MLGSRSVLPRGLRVNPVPCLSCSSPSPLLQLFGAGSICLLFRTLWVAPWAVQRTLMIGAFYSSRPLILSSTEGPSSSDLK